MKKISKKIITLGTLTIAGFGIGCSNDKTVTETVTEETKEVFQNAKSATQKTTNEVTAATSKAWNSFTGYTIDKKDDAAAFLEKQVQNLDTQIDNLKRSGENASEATREKLRVAVDTLEEKRRDLVLQIKKTKNATAETWDDVKNETQKKWNDFTQFLEKTRNDIS